MTIEGPLLGDYCEACRAEAQPLALWEVPSGQMFTLCGKCRVRHAALTPGTREEIWEKVKRRAGLAS